jgi:Mrp family chromosome partitioning ATPase
LLCAARRLAERGVRLVLVDADLSRPRLAKRLGVQPQSGWNEISGEDGTFLASAVVEAAASNLALSGVREPASPNDRACGDWSRLAPCIKTLKNHYEMVLVDLGPLEDIESIGDSLGRTTGGKIDAVLLVRNPRLTTEARLAAVEQQLTAAGVALAGVIENFVA